MGPDGGAERADRDQGNEQSHREAAPESKECRLGFPVLPDDWAGGDSLDQRLAEILDREHHLRDGDASRQIEEDHARRVITREASDDLLADLPPDAVGLVLHHE